MPRIRKQIRQIMSEMDARSAGMRPGSVLILVVVLLVLMALLGTAYLVTSRNERVATKLYTHNVQIDMLVQGVENMAIASLTDTTFQRSDAQRYDDWYTTGATPLLPAGAAAVDHSYLASRYPDYFNNTLGALTGTPLYPIPKGVMVNFGGTIYESLADNNTTAPPGGNWLAITGLGNNPTWTAVSAPLVTKSVNEDPRFPAVNVRPDNIRTMVQPSFVTVGGTNYPGLQYYSTQSNPLSGSIPAHSPQVETCLAASASGNGIADSFLWRLPIGTIDGITYYAAVRIIDNNSAINVNTANSSSNDFGFNGAALTNPGFSPGIFPAGIGLAELLYTYTPSQNNSDLTISPELLALNNVRFNATTTGQKPAGIVGAGSSPLDDGGAARTGFDYISEGDALHMGLGRRIGNPGMANMSGATKLPFQALSWGDSAALAWRFDLSNPNASPTVTEQSLATSVWSPAAPIGPLAASYKPTLQSTPWPPSQVSAWFNQYIEPAAPGGNASLNRRAYFTARNPTSNLMPVHALNAQTTGLSQAVLTNILPYMIPTSPNSPSSNYLTGIAPRVSLNTADVSALDASANNAVPTSKGPTLWFGFYNAMLDALPTVPATTIANPNITAIPQGVGQFRSPIRDVNGFGTGGAAGTSYTGATTYLTGPETVLLRSLLAAVNAKDLRDSGDNVTTCNIPGFPYVAQGTNQTGILRAYGTERQVFITEVYVNNEVNATQTLGNPPVNNPNAGKSNPKGFVAVEIYNPYDYPVDMTWWTLAIVTRQKGPPQVLAAAPITKFNGFANGDGQTAMLPGHSFMVLVNKPPANVTGASANDATYIPSNVAIDAGAIQYYVPNLHEVMQNSLNQTAGELVLLRQIYAHGASGPNPNGMTQAALPSYLMNFAPVDSFDFTGMALSPGTVGSPLSSYHYVRANPGKNAGNPTTSWKFVYPGRWDANLPTNLPFRQEGIEPTPTGSWTAGDPKVNPTPVGQYDPWVDAPPTSKAGQPTPIALGLNDNFPSYINNFPSIQLNNTDMGGPNKTFATPYAFPFGGFARLGDVLQTPFIGAYTLLDSTGANLIEINPVTRDCAAADDWDPSTNATLTATTSDDTIEQVGRFCPLLATEQIATGTENFVTPTSFDPYGWANHVLDFFTAIQNPSDDYLPNIDPNESEYGPWDMPNLTYHYGPGTANGLFPPSPMLVQNSLNVQPNLGHEDLAPVEGLININTANWRALAAVPWIPTVNTATASQNTSIAQAIVSFRNTYGPFKTLFDLNKVPGVQNYLGTVNPASADLTPAQGNISPLWTSGAPAGAFASDNVFGDFETRFGMITRVSNLITTRSDTFTVYVLVQGWSGVGTVNPALVVQRRAAFIADRSQMTGSNPALNITPVQAN